VRYGDNRTPIYRLYFNQHMFKFVILKIRKQFDKFIFFFYKNIKKAIIVQVAIMILKKHIVI
jgi:hypothetical protein